ncbi:RNA polymerase sigma factor [Cohnella sp. AR92]|uniref:RNA polymerase sigma factor n=1 Tax=Cohnella sp. AR92 TaxID=648716 RepID=UPI000F8E717F|nr:sigma-70 family RNA polymerase sigma factor [Cohnella sp. AR92]RUS46526.1 sigma-70 family RNA polymerase sigma factor [Cohnella sp. AR92]
MEDTRIIDMYWSRNEAAIRESSTKYGRMLKRISFNILSNDGDSEECVNDTYGKAWDSMPPQKPNSLAAYLGRIARNLSINRWHANHARKRGCGADALISELSDCIPSPLSTEEETEARALSETISRWLNSLPQDDRVLFLRRYWFGDSLNSLAAECATTPNKLAGRIYRLRHKLRSALEKEGVTL